MNLASVEAVVKALLYEGYILYPYRASNVKNRQRWTFGGLYPRDYTRLDENSASWNQTECLVRGSLASEVEIHVRFLHVVRREVGSFASTMTERPADGEPACTIVPRLTLNGDVFQSWDEAVEREIVASSRLSELVCGPPLTIPFAVSGDRDVKPLHGPDGQLHGLLIHTSSDLRGELTIAATDVGPGQFRLTIRIDNITPYPDAEPNQPLQPHWCAFASTHTILGIQGGAFVSLLDPGALADAAAACHNQGTWPVLVGETGSADTILSSPIILYDYPEVAPESPGDLFDATEIDEILTLRILALTDEEKREMAALDTRARALLDRTQALSAVDLARLHGARRALHCYTDPRIGGRDLCVGDRVRLRPKARADIFDLVLKDEVAVIEAIERDLEDRIHVAVVLEADPGRELGLDRMPGHRFFFSPDEIEPIAERIST
jgi:hypothetical protein